ncbi:hypothetical protein D7319_06645 [Streptomyces radicis]|uniref:Uncharacterized protein n=1 Tax=Streptomyces radicis TaxID=1750517 RepID=A0A3A9WE44_9ACTN|nr:hypothetical protein D7319_06645 [Streptomyces radicis]RKN26390.1 hypothetical protein D7318_03015 [Streptomyces radicis]
MVIYLCHPSESTTLAAAARLRAHADARDWAVAAEVLDVTAVVPRAGVERARSYVLLRQAHGILTTTREAPALASERDWLAEHGAFLQVVGDDR